MFKRVQGVFQSTKSQIAGGIFLAFLAVVAIETLANSVTWSTDFNTSNGTQVVSIARHGERLKIKTRGEVVVTADESDVETLAPNAFLEIEERVSGRQQRLKMTPDADGKPIYEWFVNRRQRPFDAAGQEWLKQMLPRVFRTTGVDAEGRVGRLLASAGVDGVFEEITQITESSVQRLYFENLLTQAELSEENLVRFFKMAAEGMESDYELARVLAAIPVESLTAEKVRVAYFRAAAEIDSDHELRGLLQEVVAQAAVGQAEVVPPEVWSAFLKTAQHIDSDHALAGLLIDFMPRFPPSMPLPEEFFQAVKIIDSSHELGRVLKQAFARPGFDDRAALLEVAGLVDSDHELTQLLIQVAEEPIDEAASKAFFSALRKVDSDYQEGQVLSALVAQETLPANTLNSMLVAAKRLDNHRLKEFLRTLAQQHPIPAALENQWNDVLNQVDHEQAREEIRRTVTITELPTGAESPIAAETLAPLPVEADDDISHTASVDD